MATTTSSATDAVLVTHDAIDPAYRALRVSENV
jgi:hypothetical protein